ncbi:MAG: carboxypeptidase regulatory-like domain-containing protein [Terriglobales bacterium]|jgi:protocatechuate 3,4-dioxygenase beta subunit
MTRPLALAVFLLGAWLSANAGDAAHGASLPSVSGTVVTEPGSQPLKKVLVQIIAEDQKHGGNYTASTDADGHFDVDNIVPGRYRIFFERSGFANVNERGLQSEANIVTIQQPLANLLFRMLPTAVITGRVTDEDGDPMPGVRVLVQRKKPGKAGREAAGTGATNDLGEYRLAGLFPGQYWVVAMPPPEVRDYEPLHEESSAAEVSPETRYLTTYYPGTHDATQSSTVTLKAGGEMPVNFLLVPSRAYRIRGILSGLGAADRPSVELLSKAGDTYRTNATEIGRDGQFEVRGVAPGSYVLRATAGSPTQPLSAREDVSVVAGDVDGIRLRLVPSFSISGHVRLEAGSEDRNAVDLTQYRVNLRPAEAGEDAGMLLAEDGFGASASIDRLGNFAWSDVSPGDYIVQIFGSGGGEDGRGTLFLRSARLGALEATTGFTASGPASLELIVSAQGGLVEGAVVEREKDVDQDHPVSNATVVAVPEERYRHLPARYGIGATDQRGQFTIRGLAPGTYTFYAWQDIEDGVWRDPAFLKSQQAKGTTVTVEEDSHQKLEMKLSSVDEEWR